MNPTLVSEIKGVTPGYAAIAPNEEIKETDLWFYESNFYKPVVVSQSQIGRTLALLYPGRQMMAWIYRQAGPRRLPLNKHFSKPLPLP